MALTCVVVCYVELQCVLTRAQGEPLNALHRLSIASAVVNLDWQLIDLEMFGGISNAPLWVRL